MIAARGHRLIMDGNVSRLEYDVFSRNKI